MNNKQFKKIKLPQKPGVYFFLGPPKSSGGGYKGRDILYIGKATSLRDRVNNYFGKDLIATRGPLLLDMVTLATLIKWQETDSVLEALILEANLIKKHLPKYNTKEKDNKSFNYVCITKEKSNPSQPPLERGGRIQSPPDKGDLGGYIGLPKVLVVRGRNLDKTKYSSIFGPYPNGAQLKEAMKIIRRIFPYIDEQSSKKNNEEFYKQLGLVPRINPSRPPLNRGGGIPLIRGSKGVSEYKNNIKNLNLFFKGKKKSVITNLKKDMTAFSKSKDFENAGRVRDQIFALNHINDVALIKEDVFLPLLINSPLPGPLLSKERGGTRSTFRIEGYDIAHMAGRNMVGVMTVIEEGELAKNEYKKFIIRTQNGEPASPSQGGNDTGALEEVLSRRLRHTEWGLPNLIVVDGSTAQINVAKSVLSRYQFKIPIVSVVKDERHKAKAIMGDEEIIKKYKKDILLVNNESHRFAITFHKKRRDKSFLV